MWEWLAQKTTECVNKRYTIETIRSTSRDDVVQEVMMYLFENKAYAKRIYDGRENGSVGMLYRTVINTLYRLKASESGLDFRRNSLLTIIQQKCGEYGIEPEPENAYKIVAILWNTLEISEHSKAKVYSVTEIEKLLRTNKECSQITEVSFGEITEAEMVRTQLL